MLYLTLLSVAKIMCHQWQMVEIWVCSIGGMMLIGTCVQELYSGILQCKFMIIYHVHHMVLAIGNTETMLVSLCLLLG